MTSQDASAPVAEDDAELKMIRSMLDAEQSNCDNRKREAHDAILKRLGSSSSSIPGSEGPNSSEKQKAQSDSIASNREDTGSIQSSSNPLVTAAPGPKRVVNLLRHKRQRNPLLLDGETTVANAAKQLASTRNSAFLVVKELNGVTQLTGIGTDSDISKCAGRGVDAESTLVKDIMTSYPKSVQPDDDAQIAFRLMVKNRFRHLPVVRRSGEIVGLLDITQCLFDGISQLEQHQLAARSFAEAVQKTRLRWSMDQETNQHSTVAKGMIDQMLNSLAPSVGALVGSQERSECSEDATVQQAAASMAKAKKTAILVFAAELTEGDGQPVLVRGPTSSPKLVGILTTKDVLRSIAKGVDPTVTAVKEVMTPDPDTVPNDCTLLDALHTMHDGRYLHVPVEDNKGDICGVLDVLDCAVATFGPSLRGKNDPEPAARSNSEFSDLLFQPPVNGEGASDRLESVSEVGMNDVTSIGTGMREEEPPAVGARRTDRQDQPDQLCLKIRVPNSKVVKRVHCSFVFQDMMTAIQMEVFPGGEQFNISYIDEDGDEVTLLSPAAFDTAVTLYRQLKWKKLEVIARVEGAIVEEDQNTYTVFGSKLSTTDIAVVVGGVAIVLGVAVLMLTGKKESSSAAYARHHRVYRRL